MLFEDDEEAELRDLVARLDRLVPRDGAHMLVPSPDDPHASVGNRLGFLRFGIEMLLGALDPIEGPEGGPPLVTPRLEYLLADGSRTPFESCEVDESIASRPPVESRLGAVGQLIAGIVLTGVAIAGLVVVARVWQWLFG